MKVTRPTADVRAREGTSYVSSLVAPGPELQLFCRIMKKAQATGSTLVDFGVKVNVTSHDLAAVGHEPMPMHVASRICPYYDS
jgi:hypothetical protein